MTGKRVAVIGGGLSGLVAIKSCLENGLQPFCFEKTSAIGGVWVYSDGANRGEASAMYNGLVTNTSKEMSCFSDFPFPTEYPPYLSVHHMITYCRDYARHHNLEEYISFNVEVTDVSPADDSQTTGQWNVTTRRITFKQEQPIQQTDVFDAVMVCTGCHSNIKMPTYPGMDEFKGQIIHSNMFRKGGDFAGQNVLVIGASHSAGDVATQCSHYANSTYISIRSGCYVFSRRGPNGVPADSVSNCRAVSKLPKSVRAKLIVQFIESRMDLDSLGLRSNKEDFFSESMMVNDSLPDRILNGTLKVKSQIDMFTENGIKFVDGTSIQDIDTVICATGYYTRFPFISREIVDDTKLELYKHVLSPEHPTLAFIGALGAQGAVAPVVELQARWASSIFSGTLDIPCLEYRYLDAKRRINDMMKRYGYHKIVISLVPYQDDLANDIGVKPTLDMFLTDPKLAFKVFFGPAYPPSYRLKGHRTWTGARAAIMNGWENTTRPTKTRDVVKQHHGFKCTTIVCAVFPIVLLLAILTKAFSQNY